MGQRVDAWLSQYVREPDIDGATFLTVPVNLHGDSAAVDALLALVNRDEYKLVVIDTLARSMDGADENAAKDMGLVIATAERIKRVSGACVLLVHHSGYDATHARGSTALRGACDIEIEAKRADDAVKLTSRKQKNRADGEYWYLGLVERNDSLAIDHTRKRHADTVTGKTREALQALADADDERGLTTTEWQAVAGGKDLSNFVKTRSLLKQRALVVELGNGRGARYRISDKGRAHLASGAA